MANMLHDVSINTGDDWTKVGKSDSFLKKIALLSDQKIKSDRNTSSESNPNSDSL